MKAWATLMVGALLVFGNGVAVANADKPLTVVELFTSQGCSSCPPADAYLGELARLDENENVLALSFHVDYWNNLGWKDPYSSADNTARQRAYARYLKLRYVYTPQMVVQGALQATGSDRETVSRQIETARKLPAIRVVMRQSGESMQVSIGRADRPVDADVYMIMYDRERVTTVRRGENSGKTLTNRNVVRSVERIASWNGEAVTLTSPSVDSGEACAVIVQSRQTGVILGAATLPVN